MDMVVEQGGDREYIDGILQRSEVEGDLTILAMGEKTEAIKRVIAPQGDLEGYVVRANQDGYLQGMRLTDIGEAIRALGAGRYAPTDVINPDVGAIFMANIGDEVRRGTPLALILHDGKKGQPEAFDNYFTIGKERVEPPKLIKERVTATNGP